MFFCKQNRASLDLIRLGALRFTAARRRERHEWQWKRRDADRRVKLQHILPKMRQTRSSDRAWGTEDKYLHFTKKGSVWHIVRRPPEVSP